jgi:micrococcal nuclease
MYEYAARVVRVIDGDTLVADVDLGFHVSVRETFRLTGIDTPEMHGVKKDSEEYRRGLEAKRFVEKLLELTDWRVMLRTKKNTGKYGRWLAEVLPVLEEGGVHPWTAATINESLVREGLAVLKEY